VIPRLTEAPFTWFSRQPCWFANCCAIQSVKKSDASWTSAQSYW